MYAVPYIIFLRLHMAAINARRRSHTGRYLAWSVLAGLMAGLMIGFGISALYLFWYVGLWWLAIPLGGFMILPNLGSTLVRHVFAPLGWHRAAYVAGFISRPGDDATAYAMCCAAWAFACKPSGDAEVWIERRRKLRVPLGDGEIVATALIASGRGDVDGARRLLRSVSMIVEDHPAVRELAGEWLAIDACERGAWRELVDDASAARWPATPLTFFLEGVAARRIDAAGAPSRRELLARWLLAPERRASRVLLDPPRREPITDPAPAGDAAPSEPAPTTALVTLEPMPRAVAAHLAFAAHEATQHQLAAAVRAWDDALVDGATQAWLARRAIELDAPLGAVDRALRDVTNAVTDELARTAERAGLAAPAAAGPVGGSLARRLRHGRLDTLEAGFTRWEERRHDGEVHPAIDEWREFVALQAAYTAAVEAGGMELRRLAFPHAFSKGTSMAAWLWNTRNEYAVSHAISKWLLAEALLVGDTEAIELGHRNCALTIPTRLGRIEGAKS
ncbi:MAG TPA: hypothetical protein VFQ53_37340 [Kofleriaceae bacterium]|nr:hypothetical protein [Kofleriaceae bacterium]